MIYKIISFLLYFVIYNVYVFTIQNLLINYFFMKYIKNDTWNKQVWLASWVSAKWNEYVFISFKSLNVENLKLDESKMFLKDKEDLKFLIEWLSKLFKEI